MTHDSMSVDAAILEAIEDDLTTAAQIAARVGLPVRYVADALVRMRIEGVLPEGVA